jgi:hypothetical protein
MIRGAGWSTIVLASALLLACDDPQGAIEINRDTELAAVVSSIDRVLTAFPVDSPQSAFQIGLGPAGSPVTIALRKQYAVVPLGVFPGVAVVDLRQRRLVTTIPLPANSGATGAAFLNDSIAIVANTNRNTVSPVNVLRGTAGAEVTVGTFPQAIVASGDTAFVLNAELGSDFQPKRPGTVTVLTGATPRVVATIDLTGLNPGAAAIGRDGLLYVVNSGTFGATNGSLSSVDRRTMRETRHDPGFGGFPASIAVGADGSIFVASFNYGVIVWNPTTHSFVLSPAVAVRPGGIASTSAVAVDSRGRLYALKPDCTAPSKAFRLSASFAVEAEVTVGNCPLAIGFTRVTQ